MSHGLGPVKTHPDGAFPAREGAREVGRDKIGPATPMKVLVQRVSRAAVRVDGETVGEIGRGLLVFLGVERTDTDELADWYARRVAALRLFPGPTGEAWESGVAEAGGAVLAVSQFTLAARTRKGRRPSFDPAAPPEQAEPIYQRFCATLRAEGIEVAEGRFRAMMAVELVNEGPVTFLVDGPEVPRR